MSIYDIAVKNYDGSTYLLKRYKGKVLIIVNTATNCTLNDQFNKLEMLYKKYHKYGLEILSFPCNDFNNCLINFSIWLGLSQGKNRLTIFPC